MPETASSGAHAVLAPGTRVLIRDAEWVIRRMDRSPDGGYQLVCDGVSELVREREAIFLSKLEQAITVLDPADTRLVPDPSPGFADSRLYIESQLRQAVPNDERIHVAHGAAMESGPLPVRAGPAGVAAAAAAHPDRRRGRAWQDAGGWHPRQRADGPRPGAPHPGAGRQEHAHAVPEGVLEPFHHSPHPARLDRESSGVRSRIPTSHNPFHYYDKAIISIDTLKQDAEYRTYLEQAYWDVIVIDEAHNVADRGAGGTRAAGSHGRTSLRSRLARLLAPAVRHARHAVRDAS